MRHRFVSALAAGGSLAVGAVVLVGALDLADQPAGLASLVAERVGESGASNPVTAVLLSFRGYDTWLEVGVLLLAVLATLAVARTANVSRVEPPADEAVILQPVARTVALVAALVGGYLLWRGTFAAGGAFQAGAVAAAAVVLLRVAGVPTIERLPSVAMVAMIVVSFAAFLLVVVATAAAAGAPLEYRGAVASVVLVFLELTIAVSTAAALSMLFAMVARR